MSAVTVDTAEPLTERLRRLARENATLVARQVRKAEEICRESDEIVAIIVGDALQEVSGHGRIDRRSG